VVVTVRVAAAVAGDALIATSPSAPTSAAVTPAATDARHDRTRLTPLTLLPLGSPPPVRLVVESRHQGNFRPPTVAGTYPTVTVLAQA